MPPVRHRSAFGSIAAVAALLALPFFGCAGSLDPSQFQTGSGGSTSGSGGTDGSSLNCTGDSDGATIISGTCATAGCHVPGGLLGAGLDLTVNSSIASRLVGVVSSGDTATLSACGGNTTPYLVAGPGPATGLLVDKIQDAMPPCGAQMPYGMNPLSQMQQACIIQWATTLTNAAQ